MTLVNQNENLELGLILEFGHKKESQRCKNMECENCFRLKLGRKSQKYLESKREIEFSHSKLQIGPLFTQCHHLLN